MAEKILVVDDDGDSLKLISLMLKRHGYEVISASAGMAGLQQAYQEAPDLIILDVMMPDMDGYEVCRRLRNEPTTAEIPIIMFTAKTLVDDKVAGFEAGADDYLTKPTHPAELTSRVKAVLVRRQQQRTGKIPGGMASGGMTIAFLGAKGGVGVSTLASSMGALLARESPTLVTDIRPGQGTLGVALGVLNNHGLANVLSQPTSALNSNLVEQNLVRHSSGMSLLLSSVNPQETQLNIAPEALSTMLRIISQLAHYRLVDLGTGLNRLSVRVVREVDHTILVTEPNKVALLQTLPILRELKQIGVPHQQISLVLFNRAQAANQMPWQEVEALLHHEVAAIISSAPDLAYQAAESGMALTQAQPNAIASGQISKLVEDLVKQGSND